LQVLKKRVLLLPSYWPTHKAPVVGAQVHEQAELLSDEFEFRVLFCLPGMGWKRFIIYSFVRILTGKRLFQSCRKELLPGSLDADGIYYFNSRWFSYRKNRALERDAYKSLLEKLIGEGWKPDMIHTRTAEFAGANAAHLSKEFGIPMLLTENCIFVLTDNLNIDRIKDYQFAIESADTVAVVSNYVKAQLLTNNFKCNPVTIGNWIDENKFRYEGKGDNNGFTILNIGHTGFTKDWPTFFRAMKYLMEDLGCKDLKIILAVTHVFDEESRNFVPRLAAEYGVSGVCDIVYQVPRKEVAALYRKASVFVSTSINETFGIATCEAMFCGVPVVATANGGIDDIISPDSGTKVGIGDFMATAHAIKAIYDGTVSYDPHKIRESVMSKFGTAAFKKRLISVYNKTMER